MNSDDLSQAIQELSGLPSAPADALELGPGTAYLIEFPSRKLLCMGSNRGDFPTSFSALAANAEKWDDLVCEFDRARYVESWEGGFGPEAISYDLSTSRRGPGTPVLDYRLPVRNRAGDIVGALGRVVDQSFHKTAMDSLARRSWKEISTAIIRRLLHDFNNTIAGIYSLSELYAERGSDPNSMVEAMVHIRNNSARAQEITRKIRHLTTAEDGPPELHNLSRLLKDQEDYLQTLLPKGARIEFELAESELPVRLDANRFRQAMLHLASNAFDAAGPDAALTLRCRPLDAADAASGMAHLEFCDNGPGFSEKALAQALEPFYTEKEPSKHPGLGLNVVSKFVSELGGSLSLSNGPTGAVVSLLIPTAIFVATPDREKTAPKPANAPAAAASVPSIGETQPDLLVYSWEDIARHPLLLAMREAGWTCEVHATPGDMLIALSQPRSVPPAALVFLSPLDENAGPLLSELQRAKPPPKVVGIALGERPESVSEPIKRNCGLLLSGASKPTALMPKLAKFFQSAAPVPT